MALQVMDSSGLWDGCTRAGWRGLSMQDVTLAAGGPPRTGRSETTGSIRLTFEGTRAEHVRDRELRIRISSRPSSRSSLSIAVRPVPMRTRSRSCSGSVGRGTRAMLTPSVADVAHVHRLRPGQAARGVPTTQRQPAMDIRPLPSLQESPRSRAVPLGA
jgi:hypothetical protein